MLFPGELPETLTFLVFSADVPQAERVPAEVAHPDVVATVGEVVCKALDRPISGGAL